MRGIDFFRGKLCTCEDSTSRFNDFVEHVNSYGLEFEVFDIGMKQVLSMDDQLNRDELERFLSLHAMGWDL